MTAETTQSIESRYGWAVAVASTLMIATAFGASYLVVVSLKPIAADFGWPRQVPSAAYGVSLLGAGIGGIIVGLWSDRRGMGLPALMGAFMVGIGAISAGFARDMVTFLAVHFLLIGLLGNGPMFAPLVANITRWFDRRRGIAVAIVASGQSLAGAVWPPLFRYTVDAYGWRATMIGYGIAAICILVPLSLVLQRRPRAVLRAGHAGEPGQQDAAGLILGFQPNTLLALLCLAIVGCCVAMAMPMVHIVAYCTDIGLSAARGAEMLSLLLACSFISRIAYGWLADHLGGLTTLLIGASLQLTGLALYVVVDSLYGLYAVSIYYGLGYGGIVPMYAIIVRELFPEREAAWRMGVVFLFGTIGMALGGYLGGLIFDLTATYAFAFLASMAFNVMNLVLVGLLVWRSERRLPAPAAA